MSCVASIVPDFWAAASLVEVPNAGLRHRFAVSDARESLQSPTQVRASSQAYFSLIAGLAAHDTSGTFLYPLPLESLPHYTEIVPNPLDLSTIMVKLLAGEYLCDLQLETDVFDMLVNCCMYNQVSSPYFKEAQKLLGVLGDLMAQAGITVVRTALRSSSLSARNKVHTRAVESLSLQRVSLLLIELLRSRDNLQLLSESKQGEPSLIFPTQQRLSWRHLTDLVLNGEYESLEQLVFDIDFMYCEATCRSPDLARTTVLVNLRDELASNVLRATKCQVPLYKEPAAKMLPAVTSPGQRTLLNDVVRQKYLSLLRELRNLPDSAPFHFPVIEPNYFLAVPQPMDLSLIEYKLRRGRYSSGAEIERDIELMVDNCLLYNGADHPFSTVACRLRARVPSLKLQLSIA